VSDTIKIDVEGDRQVGLRFDEFPDVLYQDLKQEIDALSNELFTRVRAATPVDKGDLLSKERLRLFTDKDRITGYIDVESSEASYDFAKAGALEYGAHGPAKVASHSMRLDHFWADRLTKPITVAVEAYQRPTNIAEHRFERGPLEDMRPEILSRLNAVVEKAVGEANG
jgi:hypothetical protein